VEADARAIAVESGLVEGTGLVLQELVFTAQKHCAAYQHPLREFLTRHGRISAHAFLPHSREFGVGNGQRRPTGAIGVPLLHDRTLAAVGLTHLQPKINE
jgi:hypothetical protein